MALSKHSAIGNARCYKEVHLFDQRYIRNTNPVNCVRRLCRFTYISGTYSRYYFIRVDSTNDKHVSVEGGRDRREIKHLQELLHAAETVDRGNKRNTREKRRKRRKLLITK